MFSIYRQKGETEFLLTFTVDYLLIAAMSIIKAIRDTQIYTLQVRLAAADQNTPT